MDQLSHVRPIGPDRDVRVARDERGKGKKPPPKPPQDRVELHGDEPKDGD
jgi:hypothetical protein